MTAPLSLTATMKLAKQASKGTPATADFICGRFVQSSLQSVMQYIEAQGEHHCGVNVRATLRKTLSRVGGYVVPFGAQGFLYPDLVGMIALGLGFSINSTAALKNEIQTVTITGAPTGGTFTLTSTDTTSDIPFDATALQVQSALEGIAAIGEGNVIVTGAAGGPYTVTFTGALAGTNVATMTEDHAALTGGTTPGVTVASVQNGAAGVVGSGHIATIADRDDAAWLTAIHSYGEGAEKFELRATDARIEQLVIEANTRGVMATFAGLGIKEDAATGSETGSLENEAMILPSKGACTINIEGQPFTTSLRGLRFLVSNPTDKNEQNLFALERSDLPSTGIECGFSAQGLDLSRDVYKRLNWGGLSGVGPVTDAVSGDITFRFESAELIPTDNVPWQLEVTIPRCEFRMGNFQARGRDLIRFDLAGLMIDDENSFANPITMRLVNTVGSY
jgi:hypothetical protein